MFEPENDLERSLVSAASDPSHRPQFYRDLLESDIFLIQSQTASLDVQDGVLQQGTTVQIEPWERDGEDWIPIFTSLTRLQQCLQTEASYLQLNAQSFFELTRGANVVLNPNHDYGKEFIPDEIAGLLDGSLFQASEGYKVEQETQVMIGQPSEYPTELVRALCRLFAQQPQVTAAYLAQFFNPARDEEPHILIGIDAVGDWQSIVGDAGMVARDTLNENEIVDFVRVSKEDSGVSQYFLNDTEPFYRNS